MKFNQSATEKAETVNHEGAKAYAMTPALELYSAVATTMLSDISYESAFHRLARIRTLVRKVSPTFVAQLALYAREQLYLRSAPVVLIGELAKHHHGDSLISRTVARVVQRPDEITELLAYYQLTNNRQETKKLGRLSKQLQKGLRIAFNKFDEYQFAKYNRAAQVKLRDALFLVHPKAKDEAQQVIFDRIVTNTLQPPYTWENELSSLGKQPFADEAAKKTAFRNKWEELVASGRLGYMATLRNLRNMLDAEVSVATIQRVCDLLGDAAAVDRAKQLPFRFLAAYREIKSVKSGHVAMLNDALETALQLSVANLRGFTAETRVVIACDVSGSMQVSVSARSKVRLYDIGLLLGMLLQSKCKNVLCGLFGDTWKTVNLPGRNVLANVEELYRREGEVGYSTNGYLVIDDLINRNYIADKVMLFTDTQLWDSRTNNMSQDNTIEAKWAAYKQLAPNASLYLFDLAGHKNVPLQVESNDVYLLAGWSDKVFDVLQALEDGESALSKIEAISL
ncbi:TROVE domain-containing protein [Nibrella viscosa]|uniref:TROVE domain-containing protein n=1 Tax=Nibrella viscosa TaxID=1084524 RepID=A0ABP8KZ00_9BACT